MKKVLLSVAVVAALGLASCGGPSVCDCVDGRKKMMEEVDAAEGDEAKIKEIKESYEGQKEACEKMADAVKDDEEAANKMMEEIKACE